SGSSRAFVLLRSHGRMAGQLRIGRYGRQRSRFSRLGIAGYGGRRSAERALSCVAMRAHLKGSERMKSKDGLVVVAGGGGFIGGHLVASLRRQGYTRLRSVDVKSPDDWYQRLPDVDNRQLDLRRLPDCEQAVAGASEIYNLAADMGGMGFIEN